MIPFHMVVIMHMKSLNAELLQAYKLNYVKNASYFWTKRLVSLKNKWPVARWKHVCGFNDCW